MKSKRKREKVEEKSKNAISHQNQAQVETRQMVYVVYVCVWKKIYIKFLRRINEIENRGGEFYDKRFTGRGKSRKINTKFSRRKIFLAGKIYVYFPVSRNLSLSLSFFSIAFFFSPIHFCCVDIYTRTTNRII